MDARNNPYTRLVALEQGLREVFNDADMSMPQTAAAIFFLADVDIVEKCLLGKGRNKDAHDLLQALKKLRDKADESMRGPVVKTMTEADVAQMKHNHKELRTLATELIELIGALKPRIGDPDLSVANPLQILLVGNQSLRNGEYKGKVDRHIEPKFSKPDDSSTNPESSAETDNKLPKKLRKDSPSRVKAKSAHDYAMKRIPNAQHMTIGELHAAILSDPEVADMVPARADVFGTYLRDAGVKRYKL